MAARGNKTAIRELASIPECPEELEYLRAWIYELYGRSGTNMDGAEPLAWSEITHWEYNTGREASIAEKEALMRLDAILRHPEEPED